MCCWVVYKRSRPREQSIHSKAYTGLRRPHLLPVPNGRTRTVCARVHVSLCAAAPCTSALDPVSSRIIRTPIQGHANLTPFGPRDKDVRVLEMITVSLHVCMCTSHAYIYVCVRFSLRMRLYKCRCVCVCVRVCVMYVCVCACMRVG